MCGIGGFLARTSSCADQFRQNLGRLSDAMSHRGPDGSGIWHSLRHPVSLVHRRLAIIDLDEKALQPLANEDGSVVVVFNGEIYNHQELRGELLQLGHVFATNHADTEVLVHGYESWGLEGLLTRLRGMFAFAIWDENAQHLMLARDRIGIKPLYWTRVSEGIAFASEIKALLEFSPDTPEMDVAAMYHYLTGMVAPSPGTMFRGIHKLEPGMLLKATLRGEVDIKRYWSPANFSRDPSRFANPADAAKAVRECLEDAVSSHLLSDVPVGLFLSGGVDSTALLACASQAGSKIKTFSIGFSDHRGLNELDEARSAARHFGSDHTEMEISLGDVEECLDSVVYHQDEPLADWVCFPLFHVAKKAASSVKVVLVGEGADEPFCGYYGYLDFLRVWQKWWQPFCRIPSPARSIIAKAMCVAAKRWPQLATAADFALRASRDQEVFWGGATTFWETQKHLLLDVRHPGFLAEMRKSDVYPASTADQADSYRIIERYRKELERGGSEADVLARMIHYEFRYRLPELLLMRVDKMTMAHSLEARVPFLDHPMVELALSLPTKWLHANNQPKILLKSALRGLVPDDVLDRPKRGFGAPMAEWLRGPFGRRVEAEVLASPLMRRGWFQVGYIKYLFKTHRDGRYNQAHYLWTLYNLTAWYARWIEKPV